METENTPVPSPLREYTGRFRVAFSFVGKNRVRVRRIAEKVEARLGRSQVFFDHWFLHVIGGKEGQQKLRNIFLNQCDLSVMCLSALYESRLWTQEEGAAIQERIMKSRDPAIDDRRYDVLPIRVGAGDLKMMPLTTIVPDVRGWTPDRVADMIVARLDSVRYRWPGSSRPLAWNMANHHHVCKAFVGLLDQASPRRFLPIRGPSGEGKSHITKHMRDHLYEIGGPSFGRFDFKGAVGLEREVRSFVEHLGVAPPPADLPLDRGLDHILERLQMRKLPTFLIFDTYEDASGAKDWVEQKLLPTLIHADWLRVVIAGQRIPPPGVPSLTSLVHPPIHLEAPLAKDWLAYFKPYCPGLTLSDVEEACRRVGNRPSSLVQLLGSAI